MLYNTLDMPDNPPHPIAQLTPDQAWQHLTSQPEAVLVDVRCRAEWLFVGVPDLAALATNTASSKKLLLLEWQDIAGSPNPNFIAELKSVASDNAYLLMLCRSGQRSQLAAEAALAAGMQAANIQHGFEGDLNHQQQRKSVNGWCVAGLPWRQF